MILIDGWPYDLLIRGELSLTSNVATKPIEDGSTFSDFIMNLPDKFTMDAMVSDTPMGEVALHESRQIDVTATSGEPPLPSEDAYEKLTAIHRRRLPVTIEIPYQIRGQSRVRTFVNMGLESLSLPMDPAQHGGLYFSCAWCKISVVRNTRLAVRTATPSGKGKTTTTKNALPLWTDRRVKWRFGRPPGSNILTEPNPYSEGGGDVSTGFAYVEISTPPSSDKKSSIAYRWLGGGNPGHFARRAYGNPDPGRDLSPYARLSFLQDFNRDNKAGNVPRGNDPNAEDPRKTLPPDITIDRVQPPEPTADRRNPFGNPSAPTGGSDVDDAIKLATPGGILDF